MLFYDKTNEAEVEKKYEHFQLADFRAMKYAEICGTKTR